MAPSFKQYYSEGLKALGSELHFTAHSHHLWPDVTLAAQIEYWKMSATRTDHKWEYFFGDVFPKIQAQILTFVDAPPGTTMAIGSNTHELFLRLLSNFERKDRPLRILSTDSEFHSFERQTRRLEESGDLEVTRIPTENFEIFETRFIEAVASNSPDLIFLSRVFFNSGFVADLPKILAKLPKDLPVVIDDYHGFFAVPISLRSLNRKIFYLAGGYKYAQWGEGACFLLLPPDHKGRPKNTGWYAGMSGLAAGVRAGGVPYDAGMEYYGATADYTPWLRAAAIFKWFASLGISLEEFHARILSLQDSLHQRLASEFDWAATSLLPIPKEKRGHFLTYQIPGGAEKIEKELAALKIRVDRRKARIRFGLGWYHDPSDIDRIKAY
jgi:kynureninase